MKEQHRDSVYWGAGDEGSWYKKRIAAQLQTDIRWRGSLMRFVRYAVKYCLENDRSLTSSGSN